jgi:hypothetical protein
MVMPGGIVFSNNNGTATAAYDGTYNVGIVSETSPAVLTTYQTATGSSVPNPFTFPTSAFPAPAGAGTYTDTYCTYSPTYRLSGSASPLTGAFICSTVALDTLFNR